MSWFARLYNALRSDAISDEIDREMAFHLAERAESLEADGMSPEAARHEARRRFGNYLLQREKTRDHDLLVWFESALGDLGYAARTLRLTPGFTLVTILSLALGIGASTAIFTLINVAMLKSLPVSHPEELVWLTHDGSLSKSPSAFTPALWNEIRNRQNVFAELFAYTSTGSADLSSGGDARPVAVALVTGGFFRTLGVGPQVGRTLMDADDYRGCAGLAVITHAFWQTEYGGSASAVGKPIAINGKPFEIVGVADPAFFGVEAGYYAPIWAPQCAGPMLRGQSYQGGGYIIGRPKPGVSLEEVRAHLGALAPAILEATLPPNLSTEAAAQYRGLHISAAPFAKGLPGLRESYGEALLVLMGVVSLVLLIACANIANLMLARGAARQREIALRLALGASRFRLLRQLLIESLLLSFLGAAAGTLFANWGSRLLASFLLRPQQVGSLGLSPDLTVLAFSITVAVLTGVLFGLAPAWRLAHVDPQAAMKPGSRGVVEGYSRFHSGKPLVAIQIALSLVMIAGAGLLLGSWWRMAVLDPGFRSHGVLVAGVNSSRAALPDDRLSATYARILERLRAIPGVITASLASRTPIDHTDWTGDIEVDRFGSAPAPTPLAVARDESAVQLNSVGEEYFATIGTRLLAGRDFNHGDSPASPSVAIVNKELARRYFSGVNAIGRRFRFQERRGLSAPFEVVGIVENTKDLALHEADRPIVYLALGQDSTPGPSITVVIRGDRPSPSFASAMKAAILEIDPRLSLNIRTLDAQLGESLKLPRTLATLAGFFGSLALGLAAIGLYGIMSYTVTRRRNEIGVRIALGAARAQVVGLVLHDVGRMVLAGVALGVLASIALTGLTSRFLYGVEPNDPATLAFAAITLIAVAVGAAIVPARRAARLDPVAALRDD